MHIIFLIIDKYIYLKIVIVMVLNKYTLKESKNIYSCLDELSIYINTLKIDETKKREKNKIVKLNEKINNCKKIVDEKKKTNEIKEPKLNYYNIFTLDLNNIEHNRPHLNIIKNGEDIKIILNSKKDNKENILSRYAQIWKNNINEKEKKEYKKLTKDKEFLKKDYNNILENKIKLTPKIKKKIL